MSTLAVKQTNESPKYAENVLPLIANFDDDFTWNIVSGGSNGVVENSSTERYAGKKSLRVAFTGTDEITFNRGNSDFQVFGLRGGQYILSYRFFKSDPSADVTFKVNVYVDGVLYPQNEIEQNLYSTSGFTEDVWNAYTQIITIGDSETLDFSFEINWFLYKLPIPVAMPASSAARSLLDSASDCDPASAPSPTPDKK